eukprot:4125374-Pyramimonas_sp.AAC.1
MVPTSGSACSHPSCQFQRQPREGQRSGHPGPRPLMVLQPSADSSRLTGICLEAPGVPKVGILSTYFESAESRPVLRNCGSAGARSTPRHRGGGFQHGPPEDRILRLPPQGLPAPRGRRSPDLQDTEVQIHPGRFPDQRPPGRED